MNKSFSALLLAAVFVFSCARQGDAPRSLGIGVYPGDPAENFAPELRPGGDAYRNLALLRAASQSSSFDFNQTAQLLTDGIVSDTPANWLETWRNGEPLARPENGYLTDQNLAGVACSGEQTTLDILFHGYSIDTDKVLVAASGYGIARARATIQVQTPDGVWRRLGSVAARPTAGGAGENELINHNYEFPIAILGGIEVAALRLILSGAAGNYTVDEVYFYKGGEVVNVQSNIFFTSTWKSEGSDSEWVCLDLGAESTFDKMTFAWLNGPVQSVVEASSDGKAWDTVTDFAGAPGEISFEPAQGRYVRMLLHGSDNGEPYELSEWAVYGRGGVVAVPKESPKRDGRRQVLSGGGWKLARASAVDANPLVVASPRFDDTGWMVATVPGTVLGSYVDNGAVLHPNYADNQLFISDSYFRSDFWYRDVFEAHPDSDRQFLHFEGINYQAEVYLNSQPLGLIDGAFRTADFDVTGVLAEGENYLAVRILQNPSYGMVKLQTAYTPDKNGGVLGLDNPTMHATIGWDWIPTVRGRNIGIYDDVWIAYTGPVTIEDPFVHTTLPLPDTTRATVYASARLVNHTFHPISGVLKVTYGPLELAQAVTLESGEERETVLDPAVLEKPHLWWPVGYGEPYLYPVSFTFETGGKVSDAEEFLSGVRQMTAELETFTPDGRFRESFASRNANQRLNLYVNGRRFVGFGGNWGFPEHLISYRAREYDIAVKYHADMHFTMIRNWVGMTGSRAFYEACDRHGVMIWQDFWLANPWDGPDPGNPARFNEIATEYVRRIRNHPSIGLYVGRNEGYPPEEIDNHLKTMIPKEHPGLFYIPHSAADGVSGGGPYQALKPADYFRQRGRDKFHSEMGMPAVMNYENLVRTMGEDAVEPFNSLKHPNPMYGLHDYTLGRLASSAQSAESFNEMIAGMFGEPADARQFAEWAQWINYDGYRAMFEARGQYRQGLLLWMSHPAWPSMVWQTYDYYFEPTAAYFGSKKGTEPLHIQLNLLSREVEAVNYHAGDRTGLTATATVLSMDGTPVGSQSANLDLPEDATKVCFPLEVPSGAGEVYYVQLVLTDATGKELSRNFYVQGAEAGNLQALRGLGEASVKMKVSGRGPWKVTLVNNGKVPALMIRLALKDKTSGDLILPVLYSDNYLSLMPGERRTIRVEAAPADIPGKPYFEITAFNLNHKQ